MHRDDVVGVIEFIINQNIYSLVCDVVAPRQTTQKVIYAQNAKQFGFTETTFLAGNGLNDEIIFKKLSISLKYIFEKENVLEFWK